MNTAYPLLPLTVLTVLAYFTTWLFSRWEIFPLKTHRKFWNYLLLITFLVSGLLGLLSVVKINYKLEIPHYDTYLKWHVAFGITMVFIAFFHLSWHLKYYFSFAPKTGKKEITLPAGNEKFRWLLLLLGLIAIINQVVFIREFITVLSGNELVVGVVLSVWMLLTGWGAFSGRKAGFTKLTMNRGITMLATLTLMPPVLIALLYFLKNQLFPPGTLVSIGMSVIAALLLLFPVCFLSGFLFTAFSSLYSESEKSNLTGKSYAMESLGSLLGGALFSIVLGRFFNSFQVFGITTAGVLLAGTFIAREKNHRFPWRFILPGIVIPVLIFIFNPDHSIKKILFPNQELLTSQSTRYGNLVVTRQAGQLNVYENNDLQFYTENVMTNEEAVHFAMVQHDNLRRVLLVSGGISGMIAEIEKYKVEKITYLETNPEIFRSLKHFAGPISSGKVEMIKSDIRSFIGKTNENYDVILLNLPPPSSLGLNRFYTDEFFRALKKHCTGETVICTSLPSTANYAEENALEVNASLWKTLGSYFKNLLLIPGEKNYFLASDQPLSPNITEKIAQKNIGTEYVNSFYLDDALLAARSQTITSQFSKLVPLNRDFYPYMFIRQIGHWLSHFGVGYKILVIIPAVLFLLLFFKTDGITAGLYTGGFTSASLEVALLLAYQVYFGSIYLATAFFFAIFMAGLAFGSSAKLKTKIPPIKSYWLLQFGLAVFAIVLPLFIRLTGSIAAWRLPAQFLFFVLIFALATAIGFEFLLASKLRQSSYGEISGINYSTDLAGSAFGAFLSAIVLLPLLGLVNTCLVVAALNGISGIMAIRAEKTGIFST